MPLEYKGNSDEIFDLEYFFSLSPDLLCIAGYDGYFKKINPAVSKTLGFTEQELLSRPIDSFVYDEDLNKTISSRESVKSDIPLVNFENRYKTKSGHVIWLSWTSVPIKSQNLIFGIAKNISIKKKIDEYFSIAKALRKFAKGSDQTILSSNGLNRESDFDLTVNQHLTAEDLLPSDKSWLDEFELLVREHIGRNDLKISLLGSEMAMSERQIFRRIKSIMGITPNVFVRIIRLEMAKEAIKSGKFRTVAEVAHAVGFETPSYFNKLYKEVYGTNVGKLV